MGVIWHEDTDSEHEGGCELIAQSGDPWPGVSGAAWFGRLRPGNLPSPLMAGLRACCACGWRGARTTPLTIDGAGAVDIDRSEDECLIEHHKHVREAAGIAQRRELESRLRAAIGAAATADLPALTRLTLMVTAERAAGGHRGHLIGRARAEGAEWSEIGQVLGVSKQAAQQRYGAPVTAAGYTHAMAPDGSDTPGAARCGTTDGRTALFAYAVTCPDCLNELATSEKSAA